MARILETKVLLDGFLQCQTPVCVGGAVDDLAADLALAVNGNDRFYIPGSSLAGPLRAWVRQNIENGPFLARQMFGYQEDNQGHASCLIVEDAELSSEADAEIRDGVGMDRYRGAAAQGVKYNRMVLPRGTALPLHLELDVPLQGENAPRNTMAFLPVFRLLLEHLRQEGICLGGGKTRGLGRVKLMEGFTLRRFNLVQPGGVQAWLGFLGGQDGEGLCGPEGLATETLEYSQPNPELRVKIHFEGDGPVMMQAGWDGAEVDTLPLLGAVGRGRLAAVLSGAGIKGALRSQAERIVRTLTGSDHGCDGENDFLRQVNVPLVNQLFGCTDHGGRLAVADVYQTISSKAEKWPKEEFPPEFCREEHVAIDRFSGGAADKALFNVLTPPAQAWEPICISISFPSERDTGQPFCGPAGCEKAMLALLLFLLDDLKQQRIQIGFAGNRGMGDVEVSRIGFEGSGRLAGWDLRQAFRQNGGNGFLGLPADTLEQLGEAWACWQKLPEHCAEVEADA